MTIIDSTTSASVALMLTPNAARAAANADTAASAARNREHLHVARSFPTERFEDPFWPSFDSRLALTKQHASYLAWRANSEYVADSRGIRSLVRPDQKVGLGFTGTALTSMMAESNDCLLIPLFSLRNGPEEPVINQVRPDQPRSMLEYQKDDAGAYVMSDGNKVPVLGKDKKPKSRTIKFELPAGSARGSDVGDLPADIHPLGQGMLKDRPDAVLAWTEGAAKADAMLSCALREGLVLVPVALTGVTMGYVAGDIEARFNPTPLLVAGTIGDIDHNGRLELLCWDSDWHTNRSVGQALVTFGKLLEAEGAIVAIVDTPGVTKEGKGGIDDYLAQQIRSGEANPLSALLGRALISLQDAELIVKTYSDDDVGRSERLADELLRSHTHTYDPTTTSWNSYDTDNGIWTDHGTGASVDQIAKELTERDATSADRYAKSRTASAIKSAGVLAAHDPRLQLCSDDCDIDSYLLNTPTGIVDLRTGELLPHSPAFAMRKVTKVGYDPRSTSPVWDGFVLQSAGEDRAYRDYLQRFYGMALIGRPVEEVIGFITGGGRNGKSTFSSATQQVLGSYADTFPAKAFTGDLTDEMLIGL